MIVIYEFFRDNFYKANASNFFKVRKWSVRSFSRCTCANKSLGFILNFPNLWLRRNQRYRKLSTVGP